MYGAVRLPVQTKFVGDIRGHARGRRRAAIDFAFIG